MDSFARRRSLADQPEPLLSDFRSQPGVATLTGAVSMLAKPGWSTIIGEHHLESESLEVDFMACSPDPWTDVPPGVDGPPRSLQELPVPVYWLEWDVAARRSLHSPLWSACTEAELLEGPCLGPAPARSLELRDALLRRLWAPTDADGLVRVVEQLADDGRLLHIAPMSPRQRAGHRLSFCVRSSRVPAWLRSLGRSIPEGLGGLLFDIAPAHVLVGVQLEWSGGRLGDYLALETPLTWQGRVAPSMGLERWLGRLRRPARQRLDDLARWVRGPIATGRRRQMYIKLTRSEVGWSPKAYAGVTRSFPGGPSISPKSAES